VKLQHQLAGMDKALVVRPAVSALANEQALIPLSWPRAPSTWSCNWSRPR
jgi:hypothetical protein